MPSIAQSLLYLSLLGASFATPARNVYMKAATPNAPTAPGTIRACGNYHLINSGDSCESIEKKYAITNAEFREMNPDVNGACSNLIPNHEYCISKVTYNARRAEASPPLMHAPRSSPASSSSQSKTSPTPSSNGYVPAPGPTKTGASQCCRKWYTVRRGDNCLSIAGANDITLQQFRSWNPDVDPACDNLWIGYSYCVKADAFCDTGSSTPVATPQPVQVGMASGCQKFYQAKKGDYCVLVAEKCGIDVATFMEWNPAVGKECKSMLAGYYYCVAM